MARLLSRPAMPPKYDARPCSTLISCMKPGPTLCCALALLVCCGCVSSIDSRPPAEDFAAGDKAEKAGDLTEARTLYRRALNKTLRYKPAPEAEAQYSCSYAAVLGFLGETDDAAKYFDRVLVLIKENEIALDRLQPAALVEYARMLEANGRPEQAIPYFERALDTLDRTGLSASDPISTALFIDSYARCLKVAGNLDRSEAAAAQAASLRQQNSEADPKTTAVKQYFAAGSIAQHAGRWASAVVYFGRAVAECEATVAPQQLTAVAFYEYGRSLGVVGEFSAAEDNLLKALALDQRQGGNVNMDLLELARLNYDRSNYEGAIGYYEKSLPIFAAGHVEQTSPAQMVTLLGEYAECLRQVGRTAEAAWATNRAAEIRRHDPNANLAIDRTPYGSQAAPSI